MSFMQVDKWSPKAFMYVYISKYGFAQLIQFRIWPILRIVAPLHPEVICPNPLGAQVTTKSWRAMIPKIPMSEINKNRDLQPTCWNHVETLHHNAYEQTYTYPNTRLGGILWGTYRLMQRCLVSKTCLAARPTPRRTSVKYFGKKSFWSKCEYLLITDTAKGTRAIAPHEPRLHSSF